MCELSLACCSCIVATAAARLSKLAFVILQQPGVPLLNVKLCHFQNLQLDVVWCKPSSKAWMDSA